MSWTILTIYIPKTLMIFIYRLFLGYPVSRKCWTLFLNWSSTSFSTILSNEGTGTLVVVAPLHSESLAFIVVPVAKKIFFSDLWLVIINNFLDMTQLIYMQEHWCHQSGVRRRKLDWQLAFGACLILVYLCKVFSHTLIKLDCTPAKPTHPHFWCYT